MAVSEGRLFALRLKRSQAAREEALSTIAPVPGGFVARIGGRMRGAARHFRYRRDAEDAIRDHYNAALMAYIEQRRAKRQEAEL